MAALGLLHMFFFAGFLLTGVQSEEVDIFQQILIAGKKVDPSSLTFSSGEDNVKICEGDIVCDERVQRMMNQDGSNLFAAMTWKGFLWPGGIVYYTYVNKRVRNQLFYKVKKAIDNYKKTTCIKWKEIKKTDVNKVKNYVEIYRGNGCHSLIGKMAKKGKQRISIGNGCENPGIITHEMMHALGFFHEQARRDRDKYIKINWGNIMQAAKGNFKKYTPGQASAQGTRYDPGSIMHYGTKAFSRNGRPTIVVKSGAKIGQRKGLSRLDSIEINKLYKCSSKSRSKSKAKPRSRSKTRRTKPSKKPSCQNKNKYCGAWKKLRYCGKAKWAKYMRKSCRKACGFC